MASTKGAGVPSAWVARRKTSSGVRFRVMFRAGGRESAPRYGGSFGTLKEANVRKAWVLGELAAMRVPDLTLLEQVETAPTVAEVARRSRTLGFDGKWALHPDQIGICNETYAPTQSEFERAERILDAYRAATDEDGQGAAVFESEMIDEASRKMAVSIVERGQAAGMARIAP